MKTVRTKLFEKVTSKVKATALAFDPNAEVILFGSRARGDYKKDSDWDFLILTDKKVDNFYKDNLRDNMNMAELEMDQVISTIIKNTNDQKFKIMPLFENIKADAIQI